MAFLSPKEKQTLSVICDTLVPALPPEPGDDPRLFALSAADVDLVTLLEEGFERATDEATQRSLKQLLHLLEVPVFNGLTMGVWEAFSKMPLEARTELLRSWATSRFELARKAFNGLKRIGLFLFYAATPDGKANPTWDALDYRTPPNEKTDTPRPIVPLEIDGDSTLTTDVLIIGSGAGGGVVAGELTAAGFEVLIVEKGDYFADHEFPRDELGANERAYEKFGALTTADTAIAVLAGSTLGGGTTINWTGSLRPPEDVLHEWETDYGFAGVTGDEFQNSLDAVSARMNIGVGESYTSTNGAIFERGCHALGYDVTVIPRNVKGCEDCGFCNFGCAFGAKQGTLKTYLQDAYERGARILVRAQAERITHRGGVVTGAELNVIGRDGRQHRVTVQARVVVSAAGAIHTSALLLRSGLTNPNIGTGLRLHPTSVVSAIFDEPVRVWQGPPMTRLSAEFANQDGRGYGVRLMTAPGHPGIFGFAMAWLSGRQHRRAMQRMAHTANTIIITRDYHSGRVRVDSRGQPILDYKLHPYDAKHLMRGILEALRIQAAAGAAEITAPQNERPSYRPAFDGSIETYLARVQKLGLRSNGFALYSAHQMASCRVGGNPALGAVDPTGESYEVKNLFVVDGSAMPTCSGVNPMLTILGMSHFLAGRIKHKIAVPVN